MTEPSGPELARRLRALVPEAGRSAYDQDVELFNAEPGKGTTCGALAAFSWAFERMVAAADEASIKAALLFVDSLLETATPSLRDSVVTCFLENVLPTTPAGHPLVVPNLGPRSRDWCESHSPYWLQPDPDARLAT